MIRNGHGDGSDLYPRHSDIAVALAKILNSIQLSIIRLYLHRVIYQMVKIHIQAEDLKTTKVL